MRSRVVLFLSALGLLSGCGGLQRIQSAIDPAGTQAARISHLWWFIFAVCTAAFVIVIAVLSTAVSKARETPVENFRPVVKSESTKSGVVAAAIAVTGLCLFAFLVATVVTLRANSSLHSKNPITIEVVGHQWWWEVHYPNTDPSQIVITANEIHVPVGMPVVLNSTSRDVIHSFWAPNINGKRDLIPGYQTAMWFQADKEGTYRGQCAEFCGHQHAHMAFFLIAESPEKFNAWLQQQRKPAPQPSQRDTQQGENVFLTHDCMMCHTIRGTDAGARTGPDLTHVASRNTIAAGTLPNNRGNLAGWIMDPQSVKPGNKMPRHQLTPDDLQSLLSYLETLK
jgi:cytochrome c oxidase subunit 2